jgi:hypothetical protein
MHCLKYELYDSCILKAPISLHILNTTPNTFMSDYLDISKYDLSILGDGTHYLLISRFEWNLYEFIYAYKIEKINHDCNFTIVGFNNQCLE